jgi:uncharacterized protein YndB with AHSA1/START domain
MAAARNEATADNELVLSRVYDAPRELVWKAWTDPKHVSNWWGPRGFSTTTEKMDVRVGGEWIHVMRGPDGSKYPNRSVFTEVVPFERIAYKHGGHKEGGPSISFDFVWTFTEVGKGRTELKLRQIYKSKEERDNTIHKFGALEGGAQTLGRLSDFLMKTYGGKKLAVTLPSSNEILLTRAFQAPASAVYHAHLDEKSIPHWWGPRGYVTKVETLDARVGGKWRFLNIDEEGRTHAFRGEFKELVPNSKIVRTFEYEPMAGHVSLETMTFEESDGETRATVLVRFENQEDRDGMYNAGMEWGSNQSFERLEERLAMRDDDFIITRVFDAPRALVFDAWTKPEHLMQWMGPKGSESRYGSCDIRPGGMSHYFMKAPNGFEMWGKAFYREVTKPSRLVYVQHFSDESGAIARHPFMPTWPRDMLSTVAFEDEPGGKTKVTLRWTPITASAEERAAFEQGKKGATMGWGGSFDVLDELLVKLKA